MNWLTLVLKWFPIVLSLIKDVQSQLPEAPGSAKKALVVAVINPPPDEKPHVENLIDQIVTTAQSVGLMFKNSPVIVGSLTSQPNLKLSQEMKDKGK